MPDFVAALRVDRAAVVGILLLGLLAVAVAFAFAAQARPQAVVAPVEFNAGTGSAAGSGAPTGDGASDPVVAEPDDNLVVAVAGLVRNPGLVELPAGSRVHDAIEAAGGLRKSAEPSSVNLARHLVDGEQIVVGDQPGPVDGGAGGGAEAGPISLTTASADQLESLPGVGPVLAQRIIDHRNSIGGRFTSVGQLRDVTGIGDVIYADLESRVRP